MVHFSQLVALCEIMILFRFALHRRSPFQNEKDQVTHNCMYLVNAICMFILPKNV